MRNVVELDTYARALHSTVPAGDQPFLLLWDMAAAFPSVSRRWLRTVLELLGKPVAAIRVIEAVNDGTVLLLNMDGVVTVGLVTSGIAQGCPLSGVLFVCATDPKGRRIHATLARSKSGMLRQCADDTAVLLRSARLLPSLTTAFAAAGRFAGVRPQACKMRGRRHRRPAGRRSAG